MISKEARPSRGFSLHTEGLTFATSTNSGRLGCRIFDSGVALALTLTMPKVEMGELLDVTLLLTSRKFQGVTPR